MKVSLRRLEARLQSLIEGGAALLFPIEGGLPEPSWQELVSRLVGEIRTQLRPRSETSYWAPNLFSLFVHPEKIKVFADTHGWIEDMVREIEQAGYECDYYFHSPPTIRVIPDARVGLNEIRAQATFSSDDLGQTSSLEGKQDRVQGSPPSGGYLIIGGKQIFPIQSTVINIGRNPLNDLVIDDLRISREHAQLRVIHGRYVIFDLDSTGGTLMNGQRVIQGILSPGDTLSLAGVPLIFSQDNPGEFGETRPYHPEEGE